MNVAQAVEIVAASEASSGVSPQGVIVLGLIIAGAVAVRRAGRQDKDTPQEKKPKKEKEKPPAPGPPPPAKAPAPPTRPWAPAIPPPPAYAPPVAPARAEPTRPPVAPEGVPEDFIPYVLRGPTPDPFEQAPEPPAESGSAFPFALPEDLPEGLAEKLTPEAWAKMTRERGLAGLQINYPEKTVFGVDLHVTFGGAMSLPEVQKRLSQIETGLDFHKDWRVQIKAGASAKNGVLRIITRDPIGRLEWKRPARPVRLADPLWIGRTGLGEDVFISVKQRIGVFGTSGSGKSGFQRVIGAHVVQAIDADLEVWDMKFGIESQHFEGKAKRVITVADAADRVDWLLGVEFPRRAALMRARRTSTWDETPEDRALVVMIDEGNGLIRDFTAAQKSRLFQAIEQGRAMGVYFVWATQHPKASNLPTEIRSQLNCRVCLMLMQQDESEVVFKDGVAQGWAPHRLMGPGWMLVKDADHRTPEESKGLILSPEVFESVCPPDGQEPDNEDPPEDIRPPRPDSPVRPAGQTVADRIRETLILSEDPLGVSELSRRTDSSKAAVSETLKRMESAREVVREGPPARPVFRLPLHGE